MLLIHPRFLIMEWAVQFNPRFSRTLKISQVSSIYLLNAKPSQLGKDKEMEDAAICITSAQSAAAGTALYPWEFG